MNNARDGGKQPGLKLQIVDRETDFRRNCDPDVEIAEIGKHILFDPSILDTYTYDGWRPVHHDLLTVCAAAEYADRRCARHMIGWSRRLQITVPVQEHAAWKRSNARLRSALRHLTGDNWDFVFVPASGNYFEGRRQRSLPFSSNRQFVIPYSDGLDSRCVSGLFDADGAAVRVRVTKRKDRAKEGERAFDQIPFVVRPKSPRESAVRSRGFKFAAITAIAAQLSGVKKIFVPESGQGALGPVLLPLHNIYPDYRSHPTFFRKMEAFITELLGYSVTYEQPRLWYTKGETVTAFIRKSNEATHVIHTTRSCWQQRWNVRVDGTLRQCGLCAACLLRRMSMHSAGISEPSNTYAIDDLTASSYKEAVPVTTRMRPSFTMMEYGAVGARHLHQLATIAKAPEGAMGSYTFEIARATGLSERETSHNINRLLAQHAMEWQNFIGAQGPQSFLRRWTMED